MTNYQGISYEVAGGVATVTIDHPPVNVLDGATIRELADVLSELEGNKDVRAVVITATGQVFIAGADIKDIAGLQTPEQALQGADGPMYVADSQESRFAHCPPYVVARRHSRRVY